MSTEVEHLSVNSDDLFKNDWNINQVSPENEAKIKESIKRNGLFKPIIVRQIKDQTGYEIIGGEHRWEQAVELGYEEIPIVNLGYIDETKAKEISVIDNARYGFDDALGLSDILQEIGGSDVQHYLPYGDTDLNSIFSASDINIDDLEIDESFETSVSDTPDEAPVEKQVKTHTVVRFKLSLKDAERLTVRIAQTKIAHGYTAEDDLTNAGDALVHILNSDPESKAEGV